MVRSFVRSKPLQKNLSIHLSIYLSLADSTFCFGPTESLKQSTMFKEAIIGGRSSLDSLHFYRNQLSHPVNIGPTFKSILHWLLESQSAAAADEDDGDADTASQRFRERERVNFKRVYNNCSSVLQVEFCMLRFTKVELIDFN